MKDVLEKIAKQGAEHGGAWCAAVAREALENGHVEHQTERQVERTAAQGQVGMAEANAASEEG